MFCPGAVPASASATAAGEATVRPDTETSSSPTCSAAAAGESGTTAPTTTRVGMASWVIAASSAFVSDVANCWVFSSRTWSSDLPGGKTCARGTTWRSPAAHARTTSTNVSRSDTATVVMLRCPEVGKVGRPSTATTDAPLTSPSVSYVGPGPRATSGTGTLVARTPSTAASRAAHISVLVRPTTRVQPSHHLRSTALLRRAVHPQDI
jgi:hypothetical protein